jgi:hypothetical protein
MLSHSCSPDYSTICIDIGLGIFAEMSHAEALRFLDGKLQQLQVTWEKLEMRQAEINAKMKMVRCLCCCLTIIHSYMHTCINVCAYVQHVGSVNSYLNRCFAMIILLVITHE